MRIIRMRTGRSDNVLAATLALTLLGAASAPASAQDAATPTAPAASSIPLPESANVPPPSAADIGRADAPAQTAQDSIKDETVKADAAKIESMTDIKQEPAPTAAAVEPAQAEPATAQTPAAAADDSTASVSPPASEAPAGALPGTEPAADTAAAPQPAPAQTSPAAPASTVAAMDPKDAAVAEQIRALVNDRLSRIIDRRKEKEAATAFYLARDFAPLWIEKGELTQKARAAIARLRAADNDGLEVEDFTLPTVNAMSDDKALAEADLTLTSAALTYARQAQIGRLIASRVSTNTDYKQTPPEPADVLAGLSTTNDVAAYLDGFNPQFSNFKLLRAKLVELRGDVHDGAHAIATGARVKPGEEDARIPMLRTRLGVAGEGHAYDKKLVAAVKAFQDRSGLRSSGIIDDRTVAALNGPSKSRQIDTIVSNLERLRWLPRNVGQAYVMVNIPDYSLKVVNKGETVWKTRIVVGKPSLATPIFSDEIENIVVNPSWHVPESIIYNEYMPAMQQDPGVLARMGFKVAYNRDGSISVTQPPGDRNALGHMKFNFPNRFNVYLHDTPDKKLFNQDRRAFSHGCMRVLNPWDFGEVLTSLGMKQNYSAQRLKSMFGTTEHQLVFTNRIPVHLTYQTAYVDEHNKLVMRDDIYGLDGRVAMAMKNPGRSFAEAPEKKFNRKQFVNTGRQMQQARQEPRPFNFFDLFN